MKVLNLYAGIGGNRKLWTDVDVTAIEYNPEIAKIYKDYFHNDNVIITDAHHYLLEHYNEFDFIWSSPPCQSHSDIRRMGVAIGQNKAIFPDMNLWHSLNMALSCWPVYFIVKERLQKVETGQIHQGERISLIFKLLQEMEKEKEKELDHRSRNRVGFKRSGE